MQEERFSFKKYFNLALKVKNNLKMNWLPMLIIDDEVDNASLNNLGHKRAAEFATKTNMLIRAI